MSVCVDKAQMNKPFVLEAAERFGGLKMEDQTLWLEMSIMVDRLSSQEDHSAILRFNALFPIWVYGIEENYQSFRSARELEAIVNIRLEMFRLIEPELRAALGG